MTPLAELLLAAKADRSVDSLIAEAERGGVKINSTARATIYKALKGDHAKNPREDTLKLFATVFSLDVRDLRQAAGKARGELGPWSPTPEADRLDEYQRKALDDLIKTIVRGGEQGGDTPATTKPPDTGGTVTRLNPSPTPPRYDDRAADPTRGKGRAGKRRDKQDEQP